MFTKEQARAKMQDFIDFQNNLFVWNDGYNPEIVIYDDLTQDKEFGWIFYWQVKTINEDYSNVIAGNGPIIIEKNSLDMYEMGTALDPEEYIEMYLEDKNKLAKLDKDDDGVWDIVNLD